MAQYLKIGFLQIPKNDYAAYEKKPYTIAGVRPLDIR